MLRLLSAVWAAAVLVSGICTSASAQGSERDPEAHGLFLAGEAAYEAGRFEDALRYFQQSYDLSPRAGLLYNIGQAADRARLDAVALDAFRRFLASSPEIDAESRHRLEARVAALEAALARGEPAAPEAEPETEPEPVAEPAVAEPEPEPVVTPSASEGAGGPDPAGLALVITGGVLVLGGAIVAGVGAPETGALANPRPDETYPQAQSRQDNGTAAVVGGLVGIGIGAVLGVIGAVILSSSPGTSEHVRLGASGLEVSF